MYHLKEFKRATCNLDQEANGLRGSNTISCSLLVWPAHIKQGEIDKYSNTIEILK